MGCHSARVCVHLSVCPRTGSGRPAAALHRYHPAAGAGTRCRAASVSLPGCRSPVPVLASVYRCVLCKPEYCSPYQCRCRRASLAGEGAKHRCGSRCGYRCRAGPVRVPVRGSSRRHGGHLGGGAGPGGAERSGAVRPCGAPVSPLQPPLGGAGPHPVPAGRAPPVPAPAAPSLWRGPIPARPRSRSLSRSRRRRGARCGPWRRRRQAALRRRRRPGAARAGSGARREAARDGQDERGPPGARTRRECPGQRRGPGRGRRRGRAGAAGGEWGRRRGGRGAPAPGA